MSRYVALLRGINVGGKNKLAMKDLARLFTEAGCRSVETYIQSGNVVFTAPTGGESRMKRVGPAVERALREGFELEVPVIVRSAAELAATVSGNPFVAKGADPAHLHVAFLSAEPEAARAAALDPKRSPGDSFALRGRDLYLHLPNGVGKTRITNAWLDAQLAVVSTVRNWRTVQKLLELATPSSE